MDDTQLVDARMRTLSALSGPTMHEIRGAANNLALHLQVLAIEPRDDDAVARRERSLAAADDGRRRLFDLAEVFVRHAVLPDSRRTEFDLTRLTDDAVALSRPYASQRRVGVTLASKGTAAPVIGRRDVVSQVMLDLLLGLLDRAPHGSSVEVAVEPRSGGAHTALRAGATTPDPSLVARAEQAMQWAGGALRIDDGRFVLELPAPGDRS
jgi:hypothetical protein